MARPLALNISRSIQLRRIISPNHTLFIHRKQTHQDGSRKENGRYYYDTGGGISELAARPRWLSEVVKGDGIPDVAGDGSCDVILLLDSIQ